MDNNSSSRVRLTPGEACELSRSALLGLGYTASEAQVLADHMVDAALCGYEYSGLPKILNLAEQLRRRPAACPMRVLHETPVSTRLHGGGHNGMLVLHHATQIAIEKASAHGFAIVGASHTWMSGRGSYYVEMLANAGLIGIHTVSSRPQVAPPGATRAAIGTNPISFGFPTENAPFVIDLGTSALMFTDLALRARRGEMLPEGVAIDAEGAPTRDPILASLGAVLPFGGHKGFALGLAMQALGVLAGSGDDHEEHAGYLLMAIKPDLLLPLEEYRRSLSDSLARIKAVPMQPGVHEIRLPSERSRQERERNTVAGIVIDEAVMIALLNLAQVQVVR